MENKRFEHIITRYLKGKATPEEEAELLQAIHASKEWEAAFRKRTAEWNPLEETEADPETDRKWNRIASIITPSESQSQTEEAPVISLVSTSSRRIWFSIAAVVLLLLVSGVTVYFLNQGGKAGTGNAEWQTIIAAQEDRSILLPDGSSVYLRENSELSYPEDGSVLTAQELLDEWGREFLAEKRRRTDLNRFGLFTTGIWWDKQPSDSYRRFYPIPARAISANPLLKRSEGYIY